MKKNKVHTLTYAIPAKWSFRGKYQVIIVCYTVDVIDSTYDLYNIEIEGMFPVAPELEYGVTMDVVTADIRLAIHRAVMRKHRTEELESICTFNTNSLTV